MAVMSSCLHPCVMDAVVATESSKIPRNVRDVLGPSVFSFFVGILIVAHACVMASMIYWQKERYGWEEIIHVKYRIRRAVLQEVIGATMYVHGRTDLEGWLVDCWDWWATGCVKHSSHRSLSMQSQWIVLSAVMLAQKHWS